MKPTKINSQEELDNLLNEKVGSMLECFVLLNFGARSSKDISFTHDGDYWVLNEIDDSEEIIAHDKLGETFIGKALNAGALYKY